jgi:hypothetical protein
MAKKILLSFADKSLIKSANRLKLQAKEFDIYDDILIYNQHDLDAAFKKKFNDKLITGSRGYGYWIWKPQIIKQVLDTIEYGDVINYIDVGCHLNIRGRHRLNEYFNLADQSDIGILGFQACEPASPLIYDGRDLPDLSDYKWIKGDLLDYFNIRNNDKFIRTQTVTAGVIFIKKTNLSLKFIDEWIDTYSNNYSLIDDTPSYSQNLPGFIEHRHDQAIFSILSKKHLIDTVSAYEYFYPKKNNINRPDWKALDEFPIHAKRDKNYGFKKNFIILCKRIINKIQKEFFNLIS